MCFELERSVMALLKLGSVCWCQSWIHAMVNFFINQILFSENSPCRLRIMMGGYTLVVIWSDIELKIIRL